MQTLFNDERMILKIQEKLPYLFQLVESENSRNSKYKKNYLIYFSL
ncbi:hypothetical protein JP0182_14450 [Helicobacter pylori]